MISVYFVQSLVLVDLGRGDMYRRVLWVLVENLIINDTGEVGWICFTLGN